MIVIMSSYATEPQIQAVMSRLESKGLQGHRSGGEERTVIGVIGTRFEPQLGEQLELLPGVERVTPISKPYKLASREFSPADSIVRLGGVDVGGGELTVMAGPCSVESFDQMMETALAVKAAGATVLRGGAFKPRSSPYSFQGMGEDGLRILAEVRERTGLKIVTEVMEPDQVAIVAEHSDILQIGTRSMQNYPLLREVGGIDKPVLLKRGMAATIEEWLMAAEYIMSEGNFNVILCERGIRTFETAVRNTLDLSAVPVVKRQSHLPVIVDPSHGTGKWYLVKPMAMAAVAAGADGLLVEVHPNPDVALCDGPQSLNLTHFGELMKSLQMVGKAVGKKVSGAETSLAMAG
ncbi:MAG: 3-deoxy-7-phosphoheptulonate synthase [Chloroflexota bacterium]|jgi:3-deoxy-7-phosphoheptulonate synthase